MSNDFNLVEPYGKSKYAADERLVVTYLSILNNPTSIRVVVFLTG
ncbi:MAG: hypothetical protein QW270_08585 [Candidatus Bathyarchaeia archaeon]